MASPTIFMKPHTPQDLNDLTKSLGEVDIGDNSNGNTTVIGVVSNDTQKISVVNDSTTPYTVVDTPEAMGHMIDKLKDLPNKPPSIYIDIEGERLSRDGTVSIVQVYVAPEKHTYLVDVTILRDESFTTAAKDGRTFKSILEDPSVTKVFFDVRNDSDALYSHFNVRLQGVQDLQLMELATRTHPKRFVNGLGKCVERDGGLTMKERQEWIESKEKGRRLFAPECGGKYSVFNERPLSEPILQYCIQDVHFLQRLWTYYDGKLTATWRKRVASAVEDRIKDSQSANYNPHGREKAHAPVGWDSRSHRYY